MQSSDILQLYLTSHTGSLVFHLLSEGMLKFFLTDRRLAETHAELQSKIRQPPFENDRHHDYDFDTKAHLIMEHS